MEIKREEINWTKEEIFGMALLLMGGTIDSFGDQIKGEIFYEVGKHKTSGKVAILPTERNAKHEFFNDIMKAKGKFN